MHCICTKKEQTIDQNLIHRRKREIYRLNEGGVYIHIWGWKNQISGGGGGTDGLIEYI